MALRIRCGSGLGDSIYLQSVARHLALRGSNLEVCTDSPEIFRPIRHLIKIAPFSRENIDIHAVYTLRKEAPTDQFQDCCIQAGIKESVQLRLDWVPEKPFYTDNRMVLVQMPRSPMNRTDGFGKELMPDFAAMQSVLDQIDAYKVLVGSGECLYSFSGIDLDLTNKTSISELIDLAACADGLVGYPSFFIPLSESLGKPSLIVWSRKGLRSKHEYIRRITPKKILHKRSSYHVFDDSGSIGDFLGQGSCDSILPWKDCSHSGKRPRFADK